MREGHAGAPFAGLPGAVVCLSSQPWDVHLRTNRQHVMAALARRQPVLFVTTGHFLPRRLARALLAGGRARTRALAELGSGVSAGPDGPLVLGAWNLLPLGRSRVLPARGNGQLTLLRIRRALDRMGVDAAVAWAYDPFAATIVRALGAPLSIYHCVDDHAAQAVTAGRRRALERSEDDLLGCVDVVFTTARSLADRLLSRHPDVHALGNVADFAHFSAARDGRAGEPREVAALPRPRAVFLGALNELKVDLTLMEALADAEPSLSVVLVGPVTAAGERYRARLADLTARPNVHALGARPYEQLPGYLAGSDVGLVPYVSNDYTAGVFPMKVYEYLAAGIPVVASGLPELASAGPDVALARDAGEFVDAVRAALASPRSPAERQAAARPHTWEARTARMEDIARDVLARRR